MLLALTLVVCAQSGAPPLRVLVRSEVDDFLPPQADPGHAELEALEEFAQLDVETFCDWPRSRDGACVPPELNRSAFVAWIDCRL